MMRDQGLIAISSECTVCKIVVATNVARAKRKMFSSPDFHYSIVFVGVLG